MLNLFNVALVLPKSGTDTPLAAARRADVKPDQAVVRAAGKPAVDAQIEEILLGEKAALAFLQDKGIQVFKMEDPKTFSAKMDSVYKDAAGRIGADLIAQARNFT
jgi:TRAP-type C4-dicarboxylate transport system substrate-binding protein